MLENLGVLALFIPWSLILAVVVVWEGKCMRMQNHTRQAMWFDKKGRRMRGRVLIIRPKWFLFGQTYFVVRQTNGRLARVPVTKCKGKQR